MPVRAPRTRRAADQRRAQIADASASIARDAGLVAVTLRAVAAEIGVAPALVAHYEPSMDGLVAHTFTSIVREELAEMTAIAANAVGPVAGLRAVLGTLLDHHRQDVTLVWVQAWAIGERSERLAQAVRREMDAWEEFLADLIAATGAVPDGDDREIRILARQILGMIDGLNAHSLVRWHAGDDQRVLLTQSVEAILRLPRGILEPPTD